MIDAMPRLLRLLKYFIHALLVTSVFADLGNTFPSSNDHLQCNTKPTAPPRVRIPATCASWAQRRFDEFAEVQVAIVPLGSVEQHGPHLPVGTDMILAEAFATAIATCEAPTLPVSPFGASQEHASYPGTLTVPDQPLQMMWESIISSIASAGVRKVILLNAHGGQTPNAEIVARNARFSINPSVLAVTVNLQVLLQEVASSIFSNNSTYGKAWEWEARYGIHGGLLETALMMHLHPRYVKYESATNFLPRNGTRTSALEPHGRYVSYGWRAEDLTSSGALGDASLASSQAGAELFEATRQKLDIIVSDLCRINVEAFFSS